MPQYRWMNIPDYGGFELPGEIVATDDSYSELRALVEVTDDDGEPDLKSTFQEMDYESLREKVSDSPVAGNLPHDEMAEEFAGYILEPEN